MFFPTIDERIEAIEKYIRINSIIYEQEPIRREFEQFDDKYSKLNSYCNIGVRGYEQFTDTFIQIKKCELLVELNKKFPSLKDWAIRLKYELRAMDKRILQESGMTLGVRDLILLPSEILYNEEKANVYLASLRIKKSADTLYKK